MGSSSGKSSGSTQLHNNSGSDETAVDMRKRKRMVSNWESPRRSRMRKQKQLDGLVGQVGQLKSENGHIVTNVNVTAQMYVQMDSENSVLLAQLAELTHRLESLNEIIDCFCLNFGIDELDDPVMMMIHGGDNDADHFLNPWNVMLQQPLMASAAADMFMMH